MEKLAIVIVVSAVVLCLSLPVAGHAAGRNPASNSGYNAAMQKRQTEMQKMPEAHTTASYRAYGKNIANLAERRATRGIAVIDGPGEYADGQVKVDGVGNVVVAEGARNIQIFNQMELEDTTVIMQESSGGTAGRMPRGKKQ